MRKLVVLLVIISAFTCGCNNNTPKEAVKKYLGNYQNYTKEVEKELTEYLNKYNLSNEQKKYYIILFKKQFVNLNYKIKNVIYDGNQATVIVDITVFDYKKINNFNDFENIKELFKQNETLKYTIDFFVEKENNSWQLKNLTEVQIKKIMGIY